MSNEMIMFSGRNERGQRFGCMGIQSKQQSLNTDRQNIYYQERSFATKIENTKDICFLLAKNLLFI